MICNRCGNQSSDNANFCSSCGAQMNTQPPTFQQPQYQQPVNPYLSQNYQQPNDESNKSQKSIFIIGVIVFGIYIFWAGFNFLARLSGFRIYTKFQFIITPISILSALVIPFLCFLFVKNEMQRRLLLVFFIVIALIEIFNGYLLNLFRMVF